jgi:D-alanine-D-alanine ligase
MSTPGKGGVDPRSFGKVGVLYGGISAERQISLMTGPAVLEALKNAGVDAHGFDIGPQALADLPAQGFDRVFIALHGRYGEDGTIQGALEWFKIPYTGSGVLASALAMDKIMTKRVWTTHGIPTPKFRVVDAATRWDDVFDELGDKVIVKPAHEGSSIGVGKVMSRDPQALQQAYEAAAQYDPAVLVEQLIEGRELSCGVLGEGAGSRALPLLEVRTPDNNFDFQTKYFGEQNEYLCPAPVDAALAADIQYACVRGYNALGGQGWGRLDLMLRAGDDAPFLLELNTCPGMTGHSFVPMMGKVVGLSYEDLCVEILANASLKVAGR